MIRQRALLVITLVSLKTGKYNVRCGSQVISSFHQTIIRHSIIPSFFHFGYLSVGQSIISPFHLSVSPSLFYSGYRSTCQFIISSFFLSISPYFAMPSFCQSVTLSFLLYISPSFRHPISPSFHQFECLSYFPVVDKSVSPSVGQSISWSVNTPSPQSISWSVNTSYRQSVGQSVNTIPSIVSRSVSAHLGQLASGATRGMRARSAENARFTPADRAAVCRKRRALAFSSESGGKT